MVFRDFKAVKPGCPDGPQGAVSSVSPGMGMMMPMMSGMMSNMMMPGIFGAGQLDMSLAEVVQIIGTGSWIPKLGISHPEILILLGKPSILGGTVQTIHGTNEKIGISTLVPILCWSTPLGSSSQVFILLASSKK